MPMERALPPVLMNRLVARLPRHGTNAVTSGPQPLQSIVRTGDDERVILLDAL